MLLARCGLDPSEYFEDEDFRDVLNFNTPGNPKCPGRGHRGHLPDVLFGDFPHRPGAAKAASKRKSHI